MPRYINKTTGQAVIFPSTPTAGVNTDITGRQFFFAFSGVDWYDALSGAFFKPEPSFTAPNEVWLACLDDSPLDVLTPGYVDDVAAWLESGGVWTKAYKSGTTTDAATDPAFLVNGEVNTDCSNLLGIPASDDFSGTAPNSGAIGGKYWDVRWEELTKEGSVSISGNKLITANDAGNPKVISYNNLGIATGDFTFITKINITNFQSNNTTSQSLGTEVRTSAGSYIGGMFIQKAGASSNSTWKIIASNPSENSVTTSYANDFVWFKIVRSGTTATQYYSSNGTSWTNTGYNITSSADIIIRLYAFSRWTSGTLTTEWTDWSFADGASGDIYIDPTGVAV